MTENLKPQQERVRQQDRTRALQVERRRQVRGSLLLAFAALAFALWRAGLHHVLPPGWWRLW